MRGTDDAARSLFSYADLEEHIPASHPLRKVRQVVNDALVSLDADFDRLYSAEGRPSIASERLMRASLVQITAMHVARSSSASSNWRWVTLLLPPPEGCLLERGDQLSQSFDPLVLAPVAHFTAISIA